MKRIALVFWILLLGMVFVSANGDHSSGIEEGKELAESRIGCDELSEEQLEAIGQFYMEQMHPGEAHETMDAMMGGEGSESLKQMHINMARAMYCGENAAMGTGMMGGGGMMQMMPMMMNMMGSGIMQGQNLTQANAQKEASGLGVMQPIAGSWPGFWYLGIVNALYALLLIGLIILVYLGAINLWKSR